MRTGLSEARFNRSKSALALLLVVGLVVRGVLVGSKGFTTDIGTFEAWALALAERGFAQFYQTSYFADYPPGYCYILIVVGWVWHAFFGNNDPHLTALAVLVKTPAILADIFTGVVLYALARRFSNAGCALLVSACYILNPAVIENSAIYGQVDSVAAGLALFGTYLLPRSDDYVRRSALLYTVVAWLSLTYSLLIKPQAAVLIPMFVAFAFQQAPRRAERARSLVISVCASVAFAVLVAEPFHASNPAAALSWLLERYTFGSNVYAFTSVNAFNLWAIQGQMWQPDSLMVLGFPLYKWGIGLVIVATGLSVWRYLSCPSPSSFLQGCAISLIAFFVLATRMHERYIFDGLVFAIACIPIARRFVWAMVALSVELYAGQQYALQYLYVMTEHVPVVNTANLWGSWTTLFAACSVGTLLFLCNRYLAGALNGVSRMWPRP